jgi:hypothetical protein
MFDLGLLALRSASFLLAFTFGIQKIGWYIVAFHSDKPFFSIELALDRQDWIPDARHSCALDHVQ